MNTYTPTAVCLWDVDRPTDLRPGVSREGVPYAAARILVRARLLPLGVVDMAIPASGVIAAETILDQADQVLLDRPAVYVPPAADHGPSATVVVPTTGRVSVVTRCVESLLGMSYEDFDIVVVENRPGPASGTRASLEHFGDRVRYVEEPVSGLSRARNAGLAAATGSVVAFVDDDVVVDRCWLSALVAGLSTGSDVMAATGLIMPIAFDTQAQMLFDQFAAFAKGFMPVLHRLDEGHHENPLFPYTAGDIGSGANIAVRTDFMRAIGGFDPALGAGTQAHGGEDLDLFIRIVLAGGAIQYDPRALVWHDHPATMKDLRDHSRTYGIGLGALIAKHLLGQEDGYRLLRLLPLAFVHLFGSSSHKNAGRDSTFPKDIVARELLSIALGPWGYWRSASAARTVDRLAKQAGNPSGHQRRRGRLPSARKAVETDVRRDVEPNQPVQANG